MDAHEKKPWRAGLWISVIIVSAVVGYALGLYQFMAFLDQNIAYSAVYFDDVAVDLYGHYGGTLGDPSADPQAIILASSIASGFCDLYRAERRTLDNRYSSICDTIRNRTILFMACTEDIMSPGCSLERIQELDDMIEDTEYLAKELKEANVYFSYAFREEWYARRDW